MTDNATPRKLSAGELAAMRERMTRAQRVASARYAALADWGDVPTPLAEKSVDDLSDLAASHVALLTADIAALLDHAQALDDEVTRLRAALKQIATHGDDRHPGVPRSTWTTSYAYAEVKDIAANALAGNGGDAGEGA